MALTVASLAGFPAANTTFQRSAGTPADAATFSFTNGVYTQGSTQYVAGILDAPGVVPSRLFMADNNTGGGTRGTIPLPTLFSVSQVSAKGQSIQELPSLTTETTESTGYAGFIVIMIPAEPSDDSGGLVGGYSGGLTSQDNLTSTLVQVPGYTSASPVKGFPQPQMRFFVSMSALLILASTQYG